MLRHFSQFGGNFAGGFKLSIGSTNSGGTIYYTLDGSDPRQIGGALSTTAKSYSNPIELSGNVTVMARYRSASGEWSALVDAPFTQTSIGAVRGDFNRDGVRSAADIVPMMQALADVNAFQAANALSSANVLAIGDINGDGVFNNADLQSFLTELRGGGGGGSAAPADVVNPVGSDRPMATDNEAITSPTLTSQSAVTDTSDEIPDVIFSTEGMPFDMPMINRDYHGTINVNANTIQPGSPLQVSHVDRLHEAQDHDGVHSKVHHHRSRFTADAFDSDLSDETIASIANAD